MRADDDPDIDEDGEVDVEHYPVPAWLAPYMQDEDAEEVDALAEWNESKHHRGQPGNAGQFGPGGGTATKDRSDVDDDDDEDWRPTSKRERDEDDKHAERAARNVAIAVSGTRKEHEERKAEEERGYDPADFEHGVALHKKFGHDPDGTKAAYRDPKTGEWNPKRAKVHEAAVSYLFRESKPAKGRAVFQVMGGGSGAGKGTLLKSGLVALPEGHVIIDPDKVKTRLPEFGQLKAAGNKRDAGAFVHEESNHIATMARERGVENGFHVVLDATGDGSYENFRAKIEPARKKGHYIKADFATIPTEEAIRRSDKRGETNPDRAHVPHGAVRATHAAVSRNFPRAVEDGLFDEARVWDNSADHKPRLIFEMKGGKQTIHDPEAYRAFLAKGSEA